MDRLQGPINPCFLEEEEHECLEEGDNALDLSNESFFSTDNIRFGEPFSNLSFHDKMPFLQMLGVESPTISPLTEPNFQLLFRFQHQNKTNYFSETDSKIPPLELESCITQASESHSPVKSETKEQRQCPHSCCPEIASSARNHDSNSPENWVRNRTSPQFLKPPVVREKKKRKRSRPCKNSQEVESQRMTHIAVERNRRKQMNDHLNALRSLMPSSFIQRGDQASIIGGAIDFVKELEQLLQSLQAQKRMRKAGEEDSSPPFNGFFTSPQYNTYSSHQPDFNYPVESYVDGNGFTAENKSVVADIEVTVIQTHVNLKILSQRRPGQLIKAIAALEDLDLSILHLNVTSLEHSVLYSFNLKIEEECKLGSAEEIATTVHQIFSLINSN
ncbi:transcription factor bHLH57-like [Tasmannia lanceolata]|uniref:transcription factor bHLH57-like n=1 Tax=Tasmannia lanceolata TaxID=3420 RepID=UPI00406402E3